MREDFDKEVVQWIKRTIDEFKKPDPHKQKREKLEKSRKKKQSWLNQHYGL